MPSTGLTTKPHAVVMALTSGLLKCCSTCCGPQTLLYSMQRAAKVPGRMHDAQDTFPRDSIIDEQRVLHFSNKVLSSRHGVINPPAPFDSIFALQLPHLRACYTTTYGHYLLCKHLLFKLAYLLSVSVSGSRHVGAVGLDWIVSRYSSSRPTA